MRAILDFDTIVGKKDGSPSVKFYGRCPVDLMFVIKRWVESHMDEVESVGEEEARYDQDDAEYHADEDDRLTGHGPGGGR